MASWRLATGPGPGVPPGALPLVGLGLATVAASAAAVALAYGGPEVYQRELRLVLLAWTTVPFVVAGMIAWRRRPDSRFGPLLIGAGLITPASTLQWSDQPLLNTVGQLCDLLLPAVWLHVFLAYPTGRLTGTRRLIVLAGYAAAVVLQVLVLVLGGFDERHLLAVASRPELAESVQNVQLLALAGLCLVGVAALARAARAAGRAPRRRMALLVDSFGAALVMVAALLVAGAFQLPGFEILRLATFGVVGLAPVAFLLGLLDARLARSGVADMVVRLTSEPAPDLRELIAGALRDGSLSVAYWLPEHGGWADADGAPVSLPGPGDDRGVTVVEQHGEPLAALLYHPSLQEEQELVAAVSAAAAIALENGRLQAELRARLQDLRGSRARLLVAAQEERRRLERDLHDGAQQRLIALSLELGLLESTLNGDAEARRRLAHARHEVTVSMRELRDIARGLHPAVVSGHGLAVALESIAARTAIPLELRVDGLRRLPEPVEVAAYYVVCESLANIGKHADARSAVVEARLAGGTLVVEVTDDGIGGADPGRGSGLRGLVDRVEALDGRLRVGTAPGGGTWVRAEIPVDQKPAPWPAGPPPSRPAGPLPSSSP